MSTAKVPLPDEERCESSALRGKCSHAVQFYGEHESLLDASTRFVGGALAAGDAAIVVASRSHREALVDRLAAYGSGMSRAAGEGRYISLDADDTLAKFMIEGCPDATRFAVAIGGIVADAAAACKTGHVAIFGEAVAILWAEGSCNPT
jgi:hypothetical protein